MSLEQSTLKTSVHEKYLKRILFLFFGLILFFFLAAVIFSYLLLPAIVRGKIERKVSALTGGSMEIEKVKAGYFSPFNIEGIKIFDQGKNQWMSIQKVKVDMNDWPGLSPTIRALEIDGLALQGHIENGRLSFPTPSLSSDSGSAGKGYGSFRKLQIRDVSLNLPGESISKISCDYLSAERSEREDFYDILLTKAGPEDLNKSGFQLKGIINPFSREIDISLKMDHAAIKNETVFIFTALGMPHVTGQGGLIADVNIAGNLNEPLTLQSTGDINFSQWGIYINDKLFAEKIAASASLNTEVIDFNMVSGTICQGPVKGSISAEIKQKKSLVFSGEFAAEKVNFKELSSFFGDPNSKTAKSTLDVTYSFTSESYDLQKLKGSGQILLDDADVTVIPVIPFLFNSLGLSRLDPVKLSDAECTFDTDGLILKIKSAHISNRVSAIQAEPGGTINMQTGDLDFYVVAVPIPLVSNIIENLPVADIIFNLKDKLTRLYVKGHWSSPPSELITKTPIKDIKEGTVGFLQDVVRNGGHFGQGMFRGFKSILSIGKNKDENKENNKEE